MDGDHRFKVWFYHCQLFVKHLKLSIVRKISKTHRWNDDFGHTNRSSQEYEGLRRPKGRNIDSLKEWTSFDNERLYPTIFCLCTWCHYLYISGWLSITFLYRTASGLTGERGHHNHNMEGEIAFTFVIRQIDIIPHLKIRNKILQMFSENCIHRFVFFWTANLILTSWCDQWARILSNSENTE